MGKYGAISHTSDTIDQTITSCRVVVHGGDSIAKLREKNLSRPRWKTALLPYHDKLWKYLEKEWLHVEHGLYVGILIEDYFPTVSTYLQQLSKLLTTGYTFCTAEKLINILKVLYLLMTKDKQSPEIINQCCGLIEQLMKNSHITRDDLSLAWRPLYDLYYGASYGKIDKVAAGQLRQAVILLNKFFPLEATKEIWEELLTKVSPHNTNSMFCDLSSTLLPVADMSAQDHQQFGAGIWFDTLWDMHVMVEMGTFHGDVLPGLFEDLCRHCPQFMDWSSRYELLFTKLLRSLGLTINMERTQIGDSHGSTSVQVLAAWLAQLYGGPHGCHKELVRTMKCLEPLLHPANSAPHTRAILLFMHRFSYTLLLRVYEERVKAHKKKFIPETYRLKDDDLRRFVEVMLPPALIVQYDMDSNSSLVPKIISNLCCLDPGYVIPKFLDHTYSALTAICEPHRLQQTLEVLMELLFHIGSDIPGIKCRSHMEINWVVELQKLREMCGSHCMVPSTSRHDCLGIDHVFQTTRHHLVHLMEACSHGIDINDMDKTVICLQNLTLICNLMPIIDCSPCLELYADLNEEEKKLCEHTKRLPQIALCVVDKLLQITLELSVCAPKDSMYLIGDMKDDLTATGVDELQLKTMVDRLLPVLLTNSTSAIADKMVDAIFEFISYNQLSSMISVDMAVSIVALVTYHRPLRWKQFADFILTNIRTVLTLDVRKQKDVSSSVLWFINLATALFCTTSQVYVQHKDICFELFDVLLDCECKVAYEGGSNAVWYALYTLSRTYSLTSQKVSEMCERPLNAWVPVREWANTVQEHDMSMDWHVPDDSRRQVVKEIVERYMLPLIERLENEEDIDVLILRKILYQVNLMYMGAVHVLPLPVMEAFPSPISILPSSRTGTDDFHSVQWEEVKYKGRNVCEVLVDICTTIMKRMRITGTDDSSALKTMASILRTILDSRSIDKPELHSSTEIMTEMSNLSHPGQFGKRLHFLAMDQCAYTLHLSLVTSATPPTLNEFTLKILEMLTEISLNDYPEVRATAQNELVAVLKNFPLAREKLVDKVLLCLNRPHSSQEAVKGALRLIIDTKWASQVSPIRSRIWSALVNLEVYDSPAIMDLMDELWSQIGKIAVADEKEGKPSPELTLTVRSLLESLDHPSRWADYVTEHGMELAKKTRENRRQMIKRLSSELTTELLTILDKNTFHHTRIKLCRTMLWRNRLQYSGAEVIQVLLNKITDEEVYLRGRSADELAFWMQQNKPKTRRFTWKCPENKPRAPDDKLICGIRGDNLCMAYDSENLPCTLEKWNSTVFVSKLRGCHRWPKNLKTVPLASEEIFEKKQHSQAEVNISTWFSKEQNVEKWISLLLVGKRDDERLVQSTFRLVKYVLRNFPDELSILDNFCVQLRHLLKGKGRAEQRLAAEIFLGVVKGTRFYSFEVLDNMWAWLARDVDRLIDQLNTEAESVWIDVVKRVYHGDDPRRFWWFTERLIASLSKPAISKYHQALRFKLLPPVSWRQTETWKRVSELAWSQLPQAVLELQRTAISSILSNMCLLYDINMNNDFAGLPLRFQLKGTDFWIQRFQTKIEQYNESLKSTQKTRNSASDANIPYIDKPTTENSSINRANSDGDLEKHVSADKQSMNYLRTLLEFLLQYYENCMTSLTSGIIDLFPMICEFANEDWSEESSMFKDRDIKQNASILVHEYMASLYLRDEHANHVITMLQKTYDRTLQWHVKVSVLKFLQVMVYSNIFVCERNQRPRIVEEFCLKALVHPQNEVREEAAKCLQSLIHCDYVKLDQVLFNVLTSSLLSDSRHVQHGAILGFGAVVLAHPHSLPVQILPAIRTLCSHGHRSAEIQKAVTSALRDFRKSHRDQWKLSMRTLGDDLVYQIENAIAPVYYA